ncbi:uroporphyrinogen-III C-methyltransferase [Pseudothauera rhizosphaerae]|uniref:uroporphyrinogen-III C-methyltransferase n=1 Tax=Pseudothauera rhizosphaerae TaxID=2565932 RepID=A0A4S4ADT1_9RHOO|nr:uroporphyrinogen-III C-methyltransferase [Pseudothauera rhizosphaerae]THF57233.1 uroporphyrinogen-III C-methyltransferase [Pseudothauera rhizosphaerae]
MNARPSSSFIRIPLESRLHGEARPAWLGFETRTGRVSLVGAGPGDAELLTVRAARRIADADAVVYDHLVGDGILELVRPDAQLIYVGKEAGNHALPQDEINRLLVKLARQGLKVVRLKGGDPFIFGRGGEEMQELVEAGIACEVVPGVTAAAGMAACTGIPLTHRDHAQTLIFTTGHLKDGTVNLDWTALARPHQTVVIYMGLGALEIICTQLVAHGLPADTPAAVVHAATTPQQRIVTAPVRNLPASVRAAGLSTPSLIVIGPVVDLHHVLCPAAVEALALTA